MIASLIKALLLMLFVYILYSALKRIFFTPRAQQRSDARPGDARSPFRVRDRGDAPQTIVLDKDQYKVE